MDLRRTQNLCALEINCGSEPARDDGRSSTEEFETQRLPIERRVPGGAAPGVLVWPFFAPFLYQGWLAFFAAANSPGLNGNLNAGIAALDSLSALESTLSGRSAWSSLKASATGGCVGEVMKAPGDAKESGPVSEPRKAAVYPCRAPQASRGKRVRRVLFASNPNTCRSGPAREER